MATQRSLAEVEAGVARALEPFTDIFVAYVFGSTVSGKARPDSDLDIALGFERGVPIERRTARMLDVIVALGRELGALGERADLLDLDLDRCSSAIAFQVIRHGRRVLDRDPARRVHLEATIARRYDDDRPRRELIRRAAERIAQRMGRGVHG